MSDGNIANKIRSCSIDGSTLGPREESCQPCRRRVPPHRPRHTFAYDYLRANNNDLVALADLLGHESLNTTRNYTRRRMEDLEEGVENVRYEKRERQDK